MAELTTTNPILIQRPSELMRGVPDSLLEAGSLKDAQGFLQNALTVSNNIVPPPESTEAIGAWNKTTRFLITPLSLVSSQFSPQTAPNTWDIITQKDEWSFQRVLAERGFNEREAMWLGFTLDMALDPLGWITPFGITKFGRIARSFTRARQLGGDKGLRALKAIEGFEDAAQVKRTAASLGFEIKEGSEIAQRVAVMKAGGADFTFGTTLAEQAARDQRAFLMLNVPFTGWDGVKIVPRQVSMMALAVPTGIRRFFTWGAEHIPVPGDKTKSLADVGRTMFRVGSGIPDADLPARAYLNIERARGHKVTSDIFKPMLKEERLLKELLKLDGQDFEKIIQATELRANQTILTGKAITARDLVRAGIDSKIAKNQSLLKLTNDLNKAMAISFKAEVANKIPLKYYMSEHDYITHMWGEEGLNALKKTNTYKGTPAAMTTNHGSMIRRNKQTRRMTLRQQNELARKGRHPLLPGVKVKELINPSPSAIAAVRLSRSIKAVTGAQYLNEMAIKFGRRVTVSSTEAKTSAALKAKRTAELSELKRAGFIKTSASPTLTDYRFLPESKHVVTEMDRHFASMTKLESISGLSRYYDASLNFLKGTTLVPFPTYHVRNLVDNIWRSYLAGVSPMSLYYGRLAMGHFDKVIPGAKAQRGRALVTARGERTSLDEITNIMQNLGTVGHNARDADFLPDDLSAILQSMKRGSSAERTGILNPVALTNKFIRGGFDVSRKLIEDPFRAAAFIDRYLKGDTAYDAFLFVNKHFFDYAHLTDWERRYMKRLVFFWSWTRNNIPYQIETLMTRPGKVGKLAITARDGVLGPIIDKMVPGKWDTDAQEPAQEFLAEWVREGAPLFIGRDPENPNRYRYMPLAGWLSTADLALLADPLKYFPNQLVPFLREPWAQAANTDFWFKRPITTLPELSQTFLDREDYRVAPGVTWSGPRRIVHVLRNIRAFNEWDRLLQVFEESKGVDKPLRLIERLTFGGSRVIHDTEKAKRNYVFRMKDIARTGRRSYLRAIRRNRPEEAKNIQQDTVLRLRRGGI